MKCLVIGDMNTIISHHLQHTAIALCHIICGIHNIGVYYKNISTLSHLYFSNIRSQNISPKIKSRTILYSISSMSWYFQPTCKNSICSCLNNQKAVQLIVSKIWWIKHTKSLYQSTYLHETKIYMKLHYNFCISNKS